MPNPPRVIIIGAGIGGLTLALELHEAGIPCRVFEAAGELAPVGVGINVLPHATRELSRLGLEDELARVAVSTRSVTFYNRFGQHVYEEPAGRAAGYAWPQFSIHRGDLQAVLLRAFRDRLGDGALALGHRCVGVGQDDEGAIARLAGPGGATTTERADAIVGCDGIHSVVRKGFFPREGPPVYSGFNMWRGVTRWPPILGGACMIRAGWLATGKLVVYPIRDRAGDGTGQLVNWVAEIETPRHLDRDWNRPGRVDDFIGAFADWHFDWLDVPAFLRASEQVLEYPMVDQDPLPRWTFGRITLLGDAAHPMVPRGSNGAAQAILDARTLATLLAETGDPANALAAYDERRRAATAEVVRMNRTDPPDAVLREVYERTGDRPFARIEDVLTAAEARAITGRYKTVAGYAEDALRTT